jgi:glycosyltransferase involved in cell wall biosynthesis
MADPPHISVIIPTYRRPATVLNAVRSLTQQSFDSYEIVVVDNAGDPALAEAVRALGANTRVPLLYTVEPRTGLHYARHAGARLARGRILAFTDDDALADSGWLAALVEPYDDDRVACAGGKILLRWEAPPPAWVRPYGPGYLSLLDYGDEPKELCSPDLYGCNLSIRRSTLFELGGFNVDSYGDSWLGDGETGLLRKALAAGHKLIYAPSAVVWHVIPPERATLRYLRKRFANQAACDEYAHYRQYRWPRPRLLRRAARMLLRAGARKSAALAEMPRRPDVYYAHELSAAYFAAAARYNLRLASDGRLRQLVLREDWLNDDKHT